MRWHCPPDTGLEIRALAVWGRARYLSVTEAPHNTEFHTWMGKKHFCFFQTAETWNWTPDFGVKGSGANHYPRAPALRLMKTQIPGKHEALAQCWPSVGPFGVYGWHTHISVLWGLLAHWTSYSHISFEKHISIFSTDKTQIKIIIQKIAVIINNTKVHTNDNSTNLHKIKTTTLTSAWHTPRLLIIVRWASEMSDHHMPETRSSQNSDNPSRCCVRL